MSSQLSKKSDTTHQARVDVVSNNKRKQNNRKRKRSAATKPASDSNDTNTNSSNKWSSGSYPYPTDYNDHFETPQRAYADIYPLLQYCLQKNKKSSSNKESATIYDPYFCTGTAAILMEQTIKSNKHKSPLPTPVRIHHKKADFYVDIRQNKVPQYDILVTNPPYSSNHKERCLEFAVNQLKRNGRPFLLLMPNYVSTKEYFRKLTQTIQVVFIAPSTSHPYEYNHPDGTGHEKSPFESVWFCGVSGNEDVKALKDNFIKFHSKHTSTPIPRWAESLQGLIKVGGVSGQKRKNPRQRKKMRQLAMQKSGPGGAAASSGPSVDTEVKKNAAMSSSGQKKDVKPNKNFDRRKQNSSKKKAKKRRLSGGNDK